MMEDIQYYLDDRIDDLKRKLGMEVVAFYNEKNIKKFTYPHQIIDEVKKNIIDDGIKCEVEITSIGCKYLIRNFGNKQDESTEYFYYKMMIELAFCEFFWERDKLQSVIAHLGSFYFFKGVNESKNEKKIQRLQMSANGSKKGKTISQQIQEIIKEMLVSKVWVTREDFYNKIYDRVCQLKIIRARKTIVNTDFPKAIKEIPNYQQYFEHKGKK